MTLLKAAFVLIVGFFVFFEFLELVFLNSSCTDAECRDNPALGVVMVMIASVSMLLAIVASGACLILKSKNSRALR